MMKIDVLLTPREAGEFSGKTTVIIDVLRASTTILTALKNGAIGVTLVAGVEDAIGMKRKNPDFLLGGERGGLPPDGFDLGNSPLAYSPEQVGGRELILTTSNGTLAAAKADRSENLMIGCLRNTKAIARKLVEQKDVILFCAGNDGRFSLDDALCAGLIIRKLMETNVEIALTDAARFVFHGVQAILKEETALSEILFDSFHGRRLAGLGLIDDIKYCAELAVDDIVPYFFQGKFII